MIQKTQIQINDIPHTITTHIERRNSIRASITKTGINIRVPKHLNRFQREIEVKKFTNWAIERIKAKPQKIFTPKTYNHGDIIRTHSKIYKLHIENRDSIKNFAKIKDSYVILKISNNHDEQTKQKYISKQLQKLLAKEHLPELESHIHRLNALHINKPINKISYKYTISRWGACNHTNKEINLSTRLLLAPLPILEYVIIHELAHLIEPNHSRRFWNIVKSIDPRYKSKKKWLNDNGDSLNL
ncbi:MAG: M48 family metallopeptidase [Nanoarchaeota archaeon]|nr:M48 family metallopeptidase [Nanoarchaeota archaeon]